MVNIVKEYSCSSLDGVQYIKVGGARYNCARSLILEDSYDCSGGLAEAKKYCEDNVEPDPLIETCIKQKLPVMLYVTLVI